MEAVINGTNLYYETHGTGTPIILLHGGLGLDHTYLPPYLNSLGDTHELNYMDHVGNGRSAPPADWNTYNFDTLVDAVNGLRQHLGHDKVILYGHSYGGFIAQSYAAKYGDTLNGLILCGTAAKVGDYPPAIPEWATAEMINGFQALFAGPQADDAAWRANWTAAFPMYLNESNPTIEQAIDATTVYQAAAWNHASGLLATYDTKAQLPSVTVPTLILSGKQDFLVRPDYAQDMHNLLPNSELVYFENSGHYPFISEGDAYMQTVRAWLAQR
ncbi:MAG: alpha/beta hydrolase [Chloroflexota bacterium]